MERLYAQARLQVRRRKRKKVPVGERQPLVRPARANEVWSMDFVFDRSADGRVIKCLTIIDDATHEAVAIVPERAIGGVNPRSTRGHAGPATGESDRQWQGVLRSRDAHLGACPLRDLAADRTGQAEPECLHRVIQRSLAR